MVRTLLSLALVLLLTGLTAAAVKDAKSKDNDKANKGQKATITKVDAKNHTVTVQMKDKDGKEVNKTFKLTEDIRYLDSTGRAAAVDVFRSGDEVLVVEEEGRLKELHAAAKGSDTAQGFLKAADQIDMAEEQFGKLAAQDATNASLKKLGDRIEADHAKMNKELRELAQKKGVTLPEKLSQKRQATFDQLSKLKGADFDRAFAKDMVSGHEKAIERFEAEAKNGKDADVRAWAEKWLPTLREHLKMAQDASGTIKP